MTDGEGPSGWERGQGEFTLVFSALSACTDLILQTSSYSPLLLMGLLRGMETATELLD